MCPTPTLDVQDKLNNWLGSLERELINLRPLLKVKFDLQVLSSDLNSLFYAEAEDAGMSSFNSEGKK